MSSKYHHDTSAQNFSCIFSPAFTFRALTLLFERQEEYISGRFEMLIVDTTAGCKRFAYVLELRHLYLYNNAE